MGNMVIHLLKELLWLICIDLAAIGAGFLLIRYFRKKDGLKKTDYLNALVAGFCLLGVLMFILGILKLLYIPVIVTIVAVLALKGAIDLLPLVRSLKFEKFRLNLRSVFILISLVFFVLIFWKNSLPMVHYDTAAYHLNIPFTYLQNNGIVQMPYDLFANMPHNIEVLYTMFLSVAGYTSIKYFVLQCGLLIVVGLVMAGRKLWSGTEYLLPLLFISSKSVMVIISSCYIELILAMFFTYAAINLISYIEERQKYHLVMLSVLSGYIIGAKYTVWVFMPGILIATLMTISRGGREKQGSRLITLIIIVLLFVSPWIIKNYVYTDNPLYPNLYGLLGGKWWSEVQGMQLSNYVSALGNGEVKAGLNALLAPLYLVIKPELYYTSWFNPITMILFLVSLFFIPKADMRERMLILSAHIPFWLWCFLPFVTRGRFLLTIAPLMIMAAAVPLKRIIGISGWRKYAVFVVMMMVFVINFKYFGFGTEILNKKFHDSVRAGQYSHQLGDLVNSVTVPGDGIFFCFESRICFVERKRLNDSLYWAPTCMELIRKHKSSGEFVSYLKGIGINHIAVNWGAAKGYLSNRMAFSITDPEILPAEEFSRDLAKFRYVIDNLSEQIVSNRLISIYKFK